MSIVPDHLQACRCAKDGGPSECLNKLYKARVLTKFRMACEDGELAASTNDVHFAAARSNTDFFRSKERLFHGIIGSPEALRASLASVI